VVLGRSHRSFENVLNCCDLLGGELNLSDNDLAFIVKLWQLETSAAAEA